MIIGVDVGTTGCKALAVSDLGDTVGEAYVEVPLIARSGGVVEVDAGDWWRLAARVVRDAIREAPADEPARAVCVSSQGISFVPVDRRMRPLRRAISWMDTRAAPQAEAVRSAVADDELFRITGKRPSPMYVLPKLLWLREHEPRVFERAYRFLLTHDFVVARLCGRPVTDHTLAAGTLLYDVGSLNWSRRMSGEFDLRPQGLAALEWPGTPVGRVTADAGRETGLPGGTMVVVGGQDQKLAALAAGLADGCATVSLGTATAVIAGTPRPVLDPLRRIPCFPYLTRGRWVLEAVVASSGAALRWFRDLLGDSMADDAAYARLDREAETLPRGPGAVAFHPHLCGASSPHWVDGARAVLRGLSAGTTRGAIAKAIMEGVAFEIRANLETLSELLSAAPGSSPITELRLFGGGARSEVWTRIIADVTAKPCRLLPISEAAALGACRLAGAAAGVSLPEPDRGRVIAADPEARGRYDDAYHRYRAVENRLLTAGF
jgi:xylulokinase